MLRHMDIADALLLFARLVLSLVFLLPGVQVHLLGRVEATALARSNGVPLAGLLVPLTGVVVVVASLLVAFGAWADLGALLLAGFAVSVAPVMHAFWRAPDPLAAQNQMAHFMKNLGLAAGMLVLAFVYMTAPGAVAFSVTGPLFHLAP